MEPLTISYPVWFNCVNNVSILEKITCPTVAEIINPTTQTTNCTSSNLPWLLQENCEQNEQQILYQSLEDKQLEEYITMTPNAPCELSQNQQKPVQLNYFIANRKLSSQLQPPTTLSLGSL